MNYKTYRNELERETAAIDGDLRTRIIEIYEQQVADFGYLEMSNIEEEMGSPSEFVASCLEVIGEDRFHGDDLGSMGLREVIRTKVSQSLEEHRLRYSTRWVPELTPLSLVVGYLGLILFSIGVFNDAFDNFTFTVLPTAIVVLWIFAATGLFPMSGRAFRTLFNSYRAVLWGLVLYFIGRDLVAKGQLGFFSWDSIYSALLLELPYQVWSHFHREESAQVKRLDLYQYLTLLQLEIHGLVRKFNLRDYYLWILVAFLLLLQNSVAGAAAFVVIALLWYLNDLSGYSEEQVISGQLSAKDHLMLQKYIIIPWIFPGFERMVWVVGQTEEFWQIYQLDDLLWMVLQAMLITHVVFGAVSTYGWNKFAKLVVSVGISLLISLLLLDLFTAQSNGLLMLMEQLTAPDYLLLLAFASFVIGWHALYSRMLDSRPPVAVRKSDPESPPTEPLSPADK